MSLWVFDYRPCISPIQDEQITINCGVYLNKPFYHFYRCANGYYGNPVLGRASSGQCRPCPCPDGPNSGRHFAASCYQDNRNRQIICNCNQGYTGKPKTMLVLLIYISLFVLPLPSVLTFCSSSSSESDAYDIISVSRCVCVSVFFSNFSNRNSLWLKAAIQFLQNLWHCDLYSTASLYWTSWCPFTFKTLQNLVQVKSIKWYTVCFVKPKRTSVDHFHKLKDTFSILKKKLDSDICHYSFSTSVVWYQANCLIPSNLILIHLFV